MPKRIQMTRTRPWRAEYPDAVIVDRRTRWGNPIRVVPFRGKHCRMYRVTGSPLDGPAGGPAYADYSTALHFAAQNFKWDLLNGRYGDRYPSVDEIQSELVGRDLACWCPIRLHPNGAYHWGDCHADVLLAIANWELA